jgi:hypothetical protein
MYGKMGKKEDVMSTPMGKAYAAAKGNKGPKKPMPPAGAAAPKPKAKPMPAAPKSKPMPAPKARKMK